MKPPAPDRTGRISKFNFDAYAVLEASQSQGRLPYDYRTSRRSQHFYTIKFNKTSSLRQRSNVVSHASSLRRRSRPSFSKPSGQQPPAALVSHHRLTWRISLQASVSQAPCSEVRSGQSQVRSALRQATAPRSSCASGLLIWLTRGMYRQLSLRMYSLIVSFEVSKLICLIFQVWRAIHGRSTGSRL